MEYVRTDKLPFDSRPQMGRIFVEGFYEWLRHFSKDKDKLSQAMAHIFDLECFYAAVQDGEITAIAACTDGKAPGVHFEKKELCQALGFVPGLISFFILTKRLVHHVYPFEYSKQAGFIEFVAVSPLHRRKGVAAALITHIMQTMPYDEYILEVADTNTSAVKLYERLGFVEFKRTKAPKGSGSNYFIYMKRAADHYDEA